MGAESFRRTAGNILRELRSSKVAPGEERIYTAGEKEYLIKQERDKKGVPVNKGVQKDLLEIRDSLELDFRFPFED